ncbi:DUF6942 family protein [Thalassotalea euphylliae]|uniref:DUF6942 family protein n=1 Tax=Thalassotalea euphylliae TaxID=1655234 RepID=UPI00364251DA
MSLIGLGQPAADTYIYIQNTPPLSQYQSLDDLHAMTDGEIYQIGQQTGNHWRKIFNVFAKLEFERRETTFNTWQELRDKQLLQANGQQCLLFSPYDSTAPKDKVHIIMGKTYATELCVANRCTWLNEFFAYNAEHKLIICPYFDYRQLSNVKITQLVSLIKHIEQGKLT